MEVDLNSRSQGQRSRSNMQVCKELASAMYYEKWLDIDDTYTHDWYQKDFEVDLRSRS